MKGERSPSVVRGCAAKVSRKSLCKKAPGLPPTGSSTSNAALPKVHPPRLLLSKSSVIVMTRAACVEPAASTAIRATGDELPGGWQVGRWKTTVRLRGCDTEHPASRGLDDRFPGLPGAAYENRPSAKGRTESCTVGTQGGGETQGTVKARRWCAGEPAPFDIKYSVKRASIPWKPMGIGFSIGNASTSTRFTLSGHYSADLHSSGH